ncbi:hypothetical protein INR49_020075 [Caranx melampygus]|nr:hypothetical protein INR49_020075 [Caranx melampygus]
MKTLLTLLLLTLTCFLHQSSASSHLFNQQKSCCPESSRTPVPKHKVKHMGMTPEDCPKESTAIVITTMCNKQFCIDPTWTWATKLLAEFEKSAIKPMKPATATKPPQC